MCTQHLAMMRPSSPFSFTSDEGQHLKSKIIRFHTALNCECPAATACCFYDSLKIVHDDLSPCLDRTEQQSDPVLDDESTPESRRTMALRYLPMDAFQCNWSCNVRLKMAVSSHNRRPLSCVSASCGEHSLSGGRTMDAFHLPIVPCDKCYASAAPNSDARTCDPVDPSSSSAANGALTGPAKNCIPFPALASRVLYMKNLGFLSFSQFTMSLLGLHYLIILLLVAVCNGETVPSSYPHDYPGIPNTGYGPEWQAYFEVSEPLPNVTWSLPRSFAGNIAVDRPDHPNDTLFFWAFEHKNGSLSANAGERANEPWLIWLNGGPGSSSLLGLTLENGPILIDSDYASIPNNYSWDKAADIFWIDQPVGTGYSTSDATGYVADEDQMAEDFLGFLSNLVLVFPSLKDRPCYLTGESYAGMYIPYITKALFSTSVPPINLAKFAIGDGTMGSYSVFAELPTLQVIETYPELIDFDQDVFEYFKEQTHLCGYDLNLTYPQNGHFPTIPLVLGPYDNLEALSSKLKLVQTTFGSVTYNGKAQLSRVTARATRGRQSLAYNKREESKNNLSLLPDGIINPWYKCDIYDEMIDFATNFSFPWTLGGLNVYDVEDALNPPVPQDPSIFLNDEQTRAAIHAPSKEWSPTISPYGYPFGSTFEPSPGATYPWGDPSVEPMAFLSELATNASLNNVSMIFFSGNDDSLVPHRGTEVVIQNMTFGGIQGFTRKPSTPWTDQDGNFAGIVHQERGVTYALFIGAGHNVPLYAPVSAFTFLQQFILGSNATGLVTSSSVIGGEDPSLAGDAVIGTDAIFYGPGFTASSTVAPAATIAAWSAFLQTATLS